MKQKFLKTILLLCALIVGSGKMWATDITYTFSNKSWAASPANWTSGKDGTQFSNTQGLQVSANDSGANGTSPVSFSNVSKVVVKYSTNSKNGVGIIKVQVGTGSEKSFSVTKPSSGGTTLKDATFNYDPSESGNIKVTVDCSTNSIYIYSVTITYSSTYTVTYDANGGTGTMTDSNSPYTPGTEVTVLGNTFTRDGYTFSKWNTQADGNGTDYAAGATFNISANTTLYAQWTPIPHTVTLGDNGSTLSEESGGAGVDLPSRSNIGSYTFVGWSTTNATTETTTAPTIIPAGSYAPTSDITLYPVYTRVEGGGGPVNYTASVNIGTYASAHDWENETQYDQFYLDENIRIDAYYDISGKYYSSDNSWRIYGSESGAFYIVPTNGAELTSAIITLASGTLSHNNTNITSGSPVAISNESTGFAAVGIARVTALSVDYTISGGGTTYYLSSPVVSLSETTDNSEMLTALNGKTCTVTLDRTLTAGIWNTFASPVAITNLSIFGTDAKVRQLKESSVSDNVLTITFEDAASIEAGKPYLVKPKDENVVNPTLEAVTITAAAPVSVTTDYVDFVPTLGKTEVTGNVDNILIMTTSNTLVHPSTVGDMKGFRGYFLMHDAPAGARAFVINFGDGETSGIQPIRMENGTTPAEGTYDLSGRRIQGQPTQKGVYIQNGKKVVIK